MVDLPIKLVIFHSYVSLSEGTPDRTASHSVVIPHSGSLRQRLLLSRQNRPRWLKWLRSSWPKRVQHMRSNRRSRRRWLKWPKPRWHRLKRRRKRPERQGLVNRSSYCSDGFRGESCEIIRLPLSGACLPCQAEGT